MPIIRPDLSRTRHGNIPYDLRPLPVIRHVVRRLTGGLGRRRRRRGLPRAPLARPLSRRVGRARVAPRLFPRSHPVRLAEGLRRQAVDLEHAADVVVGAAGRPRLHDGRIEGLLLKGLLQKIEKKKILKIITNVLIK